MTSSVQLSRTHKIRVLLICSMSLFMVGLDVTAVNVALPSIGRQMDASLSWLQWTVSAYTVVMASLLLFSGSMADRLGRNRTLVHWPQRVLGRIAVVQPRLDRRVARRLPRPAGHRR